MKYYVTAAFALLLLFLVVPSQTYAACFDATTLAAIGNTSISSPCTVAANTSEVNDYTTSENSVNAAVTTITAAVTVNSGTTGTTVFGSGSFSIGTGGSIAIGSTSVTIKPGYPVWVTDAEADGWPADWTFATATASGKRRLGLMRGLTSDCSDAAYSEANSCYSYGQAWYYSYGQSWYYGYGQGWYYGYGQSGYWIYGYGYSQCFPKNTTIRMADGSLRRIQDLKPGDPIMSYDTVTGEPIANTVETMILHPVPGGYLVFNGTLRINPGYLVWVNGKQSYIRAGDVEVGDELLTAGGETMSVSTIEPVSGAYTGFHLTLTDKTHNNFFAGDVLVLQH